MLSLLRSYLKISTGQPLFYNALYILGVSLVPGLLGFIFWKLCSYFFTPSNVGMGAAFLSAAGIIIGLANMGINVGIIRYLPSASDPDLLHNAALSVNIIAAFGFTFLYLAGTSIWSPELVPFIVRPIYLISFIVYIIVNVIGVYLRGVFIALRKASFAFTYTVIANVISLVVLIMMLNYPPLAILASNTIGYGVALLIAWFFFRQKAEAIFHYRFRIDWDILKRIVPYSFSSHLATFMFSSFQSIFPLIVLNILGSEASGQIYVVLMLFGAAISPGLSLGYSALSEAANDVENKQRYLRKAMQVGVGLAVITGVCLLPTSRWILLLFGENYPLAGTVALQWLAIALPFVMINQIYSHMLRGFDLSKELVWMNLILFILSIVISIYLIPTMGITAVSVGLISSNLIVTILWLRKIIRLLFGQVHHLVVDR